MNLRFFLFTFILIVCFLSQINSSPLPNSESSYAPMANLEGEPSSYVHGCVNVITGQFCEFQTDLVLYHAVNPIQIERSFAGGTTNFAEIGTGWELNHRSFLIRKSDSDEKDRQICYFQDDHGVHPMTFKEDIRSHKFHVDTKCFNKGVTNTAQKKISGQTNLKNVQFFDIKAPDLAIYKGHIRNGNGGQREYSLSSKKKDSYLLRRDKKITGNIWSYHYDSNDKLLKIVLKNKEDDIAGYISFKEPVPKSIYKKIPHYKIKTSDGRHVSYQFGKINKKVTMLKSVSSSNHPKVEYEYSLRESRHQEFNLISMRKLPRGRILEINYYDAKENVVIGQNIDFTNERGAPQVNRVKNLCAPAGVDDTRIPIYQFVYDLATVKHGWDRIASHGTCDVYNALGHRVQYGFNTDHRLTCINKFNEINLPYTQERLYWGENGSKDTSCLITRALYSGSGTTFARNYQYDLAGNVLVDSLYGNLTGHNSSSPVILPNGDVIENGCDCFRKCQLYSQDGLNLLIQEFDGILLTQYFYAPESNRLIGKLQGSHEKWERRNYYFYNEDAALIKEISDDGCQMDYRDLSGVTERKIIDYTPSKIYPVGYPLVIEEKCLNLETGQEELIHKVVNTYNKCAKILEQKHYDSHGVYAYSLIWDYDNLGNIIKEINAIGQTTTREYDANCNCILEDRGDRYSTKKFTYDFMNRLIREEEVFPDAQNRIVTHRYDLVSNRIATVDANGNEIQYKYDAFGRLIETTYPPVLNESKVLSLMITKKEYDMMSKVTKEIDARGFETQMRYTTRGQLAEIIYPDGTTEKNTYCINGLLRESKAKNNTVTKYFYDIFSRPTKIEIFDSNGELLSVSTTVYQGSRILSEIDPAGIVTDYTYYPNGKLKTKQKGDHLITFVYDSLGREHKTIERYGLEETDVTIKCLTYDPLNRVISEIVRNGDYRIVFRVGYEYDIQGNICKTINYNSAGLNITLTEYDCHNELYCLTDSEGNQTISHINYNFRNELGQIVPCKTVTDPKGCVSTVVGDVLGRAVLNVKKNAFGKVIQKQELAYDLKGNLCLSIDTLINEGDSDREIICMMSYNSVNQLTACYEACATPEQKQTRLTYNDFGQKESLIKNDGVSLWHDYDALGRLKTLSSSDGTIHYTYEYDLSNHPIKVIDEIHGTVTHRMYDSNGRMIYEGLGNQLGITYESDLTGRTTLLTLPDQSKIAYEYRASQLRTVSRLNIFNDPIYVHHYEKYDHSCNLEKSHLAGNAGVLSHGYDVLGRLKSSSVGSDWQEKIERYDSIGNILAIDLKDGFGEISSSYTYDDLYQIATEEGVDVHTYIYDSNYNRRAKDGRKYQLNLLHQIIDDGINVYSYDYNGNMKTKASDDEISLFTYDALDRLTSFVKGDQKIAYHYDENNRRLSKTLFVSADEGWKANKTIRYLYQGQNEIGAVTEDGEITELRVLGIGKGAEIGAAVAIELDHKLYVPIHDHIGNVSCLMDSVSGTIVETYRYSSFGEELFDGLAAICPWRFSSKRVDEESGLIYFGRRYYDAGIGRWTTPDPIGREGGPNLYAYVLNGPLGNFDLYGLFGMSSLIGGLEKLFSYIGNSLIKIFSSLPKLPGNLISLAARQFVPLPYVQELIDFGGWCLRGENPSAYEWDQFQSKFLFYQGTNQKNPNDVHICANGIMTSEMDQTERMIEYSRSHGDVTVYGLYTGCRGLIYDLLEAGMQKIGIPTYGQQLGMKAMHWLMGQQGENRDNTTFHIEAHSRGNETVYHYDKWVRDKTVLTGLAPARIAPKGHYKKADYYIAPMDVVPFLSPVEYYKGIKNGNVHFLPTQGNPISDHLYDNKGFQKMRRLLGSDYQNGRAA